MADHGWIHSRLTGCQASKLLGVAEERLDRPTATFAQHNDGPIAVQVIGGQPLDVPVTVSGHDQPQGTILGHVCHKAADTLHQTGG